MKLSKIGLIAVAAMVLLSPAAAFAQKAPKIDDAKHKQGQKEAPAVVMASGTACAMSDALYIGGVPDDKAKTKSDFYEVSCTGSIGRVIQATTGTDKKAPIAPTFTVFDCIKASEPGPDGKPGSLACQLPGNQDAAAELQPFAAKAGLDCKVDKGRSIGSNAMNAFFEIACGNGQGYILAAPASFDTTKDVSPSSCLLYEAGGNISCTLTDKAKLLTDMVTPLAAKADANCMVKDKRYILSTNAGDQYFEVACQSGSGFVAVADSKGGFKQKIDCANADAIAGGCTMTDTKTAKTDDNALYTKLAKAGGFNCDVSGYRSLSSDGMGETVEVQCGNRPDGAMAVLPKTGAPRFYNCAAAQTAGFACKLTPAAAANASLTAAVKKARPTSTCMVSDSKFDGIAPDAGYLEVACSDKEPGYVLRYPKTSDQPSDVYYCTQAKTILNVSCALPTNVTK